MSMDMEQGWFLHDEWTYTPHDDTFLLARYADGRIAGPCQAKCLVWNQTGDNAIVQYFPFPESVAKHLHVPEAPKPVPEPDYAMHELLDRVSMICGLFDDAVFCHEKMPLFEKRITKVVKHLNKLYQEIGAVHGGDK